MSAFFFFFSFDTNHNRRDRLPKQKRSMSRSSKEKLNKSIIPNTNHIWLSFQLHKKKLHTLLYESFTFVLRLLFLPWGFFFCCEVFSFAVSLFFCCEVISFAVTVVGHPIYHLVRDNEQKTFPFRTYEERLLFSSRSTFSLLNSCAQLTKCQFCHANAVFDPEFYRRKIIKNLRPLLRKLLQIKKALKIIFVTKVHRHKSALRSVERFGSLQSSHVASSITFSRLFLLFLILCFWINCNVCYVSYNTWKKWIPEFRMQCKTIECYC